AGQRCQQVEFGWRHVDRARPDRYPQRAPIERDRPCPDYVARVAGGVDPPEHRADARNQLTGTERLGDVVVGADLEPGELVALVYPRRQHDDRHVRLLAQRPRDVHAVEVRKAQVEDDQIGTATPRGGERVGTGAGDHDAKPGPLEIVARDLRDPRLIVHDEDGLLCHECVCGTDGPMGVGWVGLIGPSPPNPWAYTLTHCAEAAPSAQAPAERARADAIRRTRRARRRGRTRNRSRGPTAARARTARGRSESRTG